MAEARSEITIDKPADEVWATVGDFGNLTWMPGVDTCELDGENRLLSMFGGKVKVTERQIRRDDAARILTYGMVPGEVPIQHEATITVTPQGDGSHVTWDVIADDSMIEMMKSTYDGALVALKQVVEG